MTLSHNIFNSPIEFEENTLNLLIIENKEYCQKIITELIDQIDGKDGDFLLFSGYKELKFLKSAEIITDLFHLNVNQTKFLTKLYGEIKTRFLQKEDFDKFSNLSSSILRFLDIVAEDFEYQITYESDVDIAALLKVQGVKFILDGKTLLEKLLDYMKILRDFYGIKLFIIPNLKSTLSENEFNNFKSYIFYNKIDVLIIETVFTPPKNNEKIKIIDKDLCIID